MKFPVDAHYNYVVVDWRGFFGSKEAEVPGYDRGLDGYDCVEWIAAQPWCDGKVGTWGSSALGLIQYQTARRHPPHLACITPQVKDFQTLYENYYYGGDYRKEQVESLQGLGFLSTAAILAHPDEDSVWEAAAANDRHGTRHPGSGARGGRMVRPLPERRPAVFRGSLRHAAIRPFGAGTSSSSGPGLPLRGWIRPTRASSSIPMPRTLYNQRDPVWDLHSAGRSNGWDQEPVVTYYQMGENAWRTAASWACIPRQSRRAFYLQPDGRPRRISPPVGSSPDSFHYDPKDPTPSLGGARFNPFDPSIADGPQDLSQAIETRPDVLVYTTPVLAQDLRVNGSVSVEPLRLVGPVRHGLLREADRRLSRRPIAHRDPGDPQDALQEFLFGGGVHDARPDLSRDGGAAGSGPHVP